MRRGLAFLVAAGLAGCKAEEPRGVQYWLDHPLERAEKLAECRMSAAADAEQQARYRERWRSRTVTEDTPWETSLQR